MELALHLHMPVRQLLEQLTSSEVTEWMAFFRLRSQSGKPKQSTDAEGLKHYLQARIEKEQHGTAR